MKKLRILHVGNPSAFKNFAICEYFIKQGHDIHYFSPIPPTEKSDLKITWHYRKEARHNKLGILKNIFFLRKVIREIRPDILHAHNVGGYGWLAALGGFSPLIIHAYGGDVLPEQMQHVKPYQFWLRKYAIQKSSKLVATGKHMREAIALNFGVNLDKISIIPRGVKTDLFRPFDAKEKTALRAKYHIASDRFVILSPRYLFNSVYNIDVIIKALSELKKKFHRILLIQMYRHNRSDKAFREVSKLISDLSLQNDIHLLPLLPNSQMPDIYNLADLCISVPSSDGFPVSILEASACKVPLIVSNLAYASEWFEQDVNGLIVPESEITPLVEAVTTLISDDEKRGKFRQHNYDKVKKEADYCICMDRLHKLYLDTLEAS